MHPLEKILILMTVCQVLQTTYTLRRLHRTHSGLRWCLEMAPLVIATFALVVLVARILNIVPYVGI